MEVGDPRKVRYKHVADHPTYHVNMIKLNWEIAGIWTGRLPHLFKAGYLAYRGFPRPPCKQALYKSHQVKHELICCYFVHNNQPASRHLRGVNVWNWIRWKDLSFVTRINMREVQSCSEKLIFYNNDIIIIK